MVHYNAFIKEKRRIDLRPSPEEKQMNEVQLKELENTSRIVRNIQNLVSDSEIKGNMAMAVAEINSFLDAFQKNLENGIVTVRLELERQAKDKQAPSEVIEAELVSQPSKG